MSDNRGGEATYLFTDRSRHRHGEGADIPAAQVLPFALVTEELQLALFLVVQAVAVTHLEPKMATRVQVNAKVNRSRPRYPRRKTAPFVLRRGKTSRWSMGLPK